jgi:hypothetical protein
MGSSEASLAELAACPDSFRGPAVEIETIGTYEMPDQNESLTPVEIAFYELEAERGELIQAINGNRGLVV